MRLLLDTHVVIWWLLDDPVLSEETNNLIDTEPAVFVSAATVWEAAIKQACGKLKEPPDLPRRIRHSEFAELPITAEHGLVAGGLPPLHKDPFDRVLIAQARCEGLTLVTADRQIARYGVPVLSPS